MSAAGTIARAPGNCSLGLHDSWLTGATGLTANCVLLAKLWAGHAQASLQPSPVLVAWPQAPGHPHTALALQQECHGFPGDASHLPFHRQGQGYFSGTFRAMGLAEQEKGASMALGQLEKMTSS